MPFQDSRKFVAVRWFEQVFELALGEFFERRVRRSEDSERPLPLEDSDEFRCFDRSDKRAQLRLTYG